SVRQRMVEWPFVFAFIAHFNGPIAFAAFCLGLAAAQVDFFKNGSTVYLALRQKLALLLVTGLTLNLVYALGVSGFMGEVAPLVRTDFPLR
ncbi:hypothetical protein, partial [Gemmatimonas sp.]|uniref:hypothetical protein n=1 Tax=Gemmatimonas sp. TaxID=1962908 RepID=UPI003340EFC3